MIVQILDKKVAEENFKNKILKLKKFKSFRCVPSAKCGRTKINRRNNDLNNLRTALADEASCDMSDHVCCQETEVLKDCRYYIH